jgi:hypothetical protein
MGKLLTGGSMYTAAVLTGTSRTILQWLLKKTFDYTVLGYLLETPRGDPLPHHMTINLGFLDETLNPKTLLGKTCKLEVDGIYRDDSIGVCAAHVSKATDESSIIIQTLHDCKGKSQKHITLCLKPQVKPVSSNELFQSEKVTVYAIEPFILEGIIQEVQ